LGTVGNKLSGEESEAVKKYYEDPDSVDAKTMAAIRKKLVGQEKQAKKRNKQKR
jgi:hypothetical protein